MTESDLWRDKFVTFEQYAEKLSVEAGELRAKINKEQRETKRLSGLVTLTASEKHRLESRALFSFLLLPLSSFLPSVDPLADATNFFAQSSATRKANTKTRSKNSKR